MTPEYIKNRRKILSANTQFGDELQVVQRFSGLTHIVGIESDFDHTFNCRVRAATLPITDQSWKTLDMTLQLHDVAEIVVGDKLAHLKTHQNTLDERSALAELPLTPNDLELIDNFNVAKIRLLGKSSSGRVTDEAILAAVIDTIDAVEMFHIHAPAWTDSLEYNPEMMPTHRALSYAPKLLRTYLGNIQNIEIGEEARDFAESLILYGLVWIVTHWKQVPTNKVPLRMKWELMLANRELTARERNGVDLDSLPGLEHFFPLTLF